MTDRTWHKGPPPHPGWWNASAYRDKEIWRWWDGEAWGYSVRSSDSSNYAAKKSINKYLGGREIEWSDYYPKDARVPRIDPRKFQQSKE